MAHHKRGRHKTARSGSHSGRKLYKLNGFKGTKDARQVQEVKADEAEAPPRPRKSRKNPRKRPWVIEFKQRPGTRGGWFTFAPTTWQVYRRYATKKSRDEALRDLLKKQRTTIWHLYRDCDFREGSPE